MGVLIDDEYFAHPKIVRAAKLSPLAPALDLAAIFHCNRELTDGVLSDEVLRGLVRAPKGQIAKAVDALEMVNRLERWSLEKWKVHDFLEHNPSAITVQKRRAEWRDKKRRQRGYGNSLPHLTSPGDADMDGTRVQRMPVNSGDPLADRLIQLIDNNGSFIEPAVLSTVQWAREVLTEERLSSLLDEIQRRSIRMKTPGYFRTCIENEARRIGAKLPAAQ